MTGGAVDYTKVLESLRPAEPKIPGTVAIHARLPADVVEVIDFIAEQTDSSRSVIVKEALYDYFKKMAEQQNEDPKQ